MALAWLAHRFGQLNEALVETQVVTHRILPALVLALKEGEVCLQVLVDLVESHLFGVRVLYGHDNQSYVGERWLLGFLLS